MYSDYIWILEMPIRDSVGLFWETPAVQLFCWEKGLFNKYAKGIAILPLLRASGNTNPY